MDHDNELALTLTERIQERLPNIFGRVAQGEDLLAIAGEFNCEVYELTKVFHANNDNLFRWEAARAARGETFVSEIVDIVADVQAGTMDEKKAKVAIDALKWLAKTYAPKQFGQHTELTDRKTTGSRAVTINIGFSSPTPPPLPEVVDGTYSLEE